MKNPTLAAVAALLAGCVSVPQEWKDSFCDMNCAVELREAQRGHRANRPARYNAHRGDEVLAINAAIREEARLWAGEDRDLRVTEHGPRLELYGPVAASSGSQVALCRHDVRFSHFDRDREAEFLRRCYDLLPEDRRAVFMAMDQQVSRRARRH